MMKKLLTAVFTVAALVVVVPSAEAGWFRKNKSCGTKSCAPRCAPKSCEKPCAPQCDSNTVVVDEQFHPCCRTVVVEGYKKCPIKETTTTCVKRDVKCCTNEMSCCYFPGDEGFSETELARAQGKSASSDNKMVEAGSGAMHGGARAQRSAVRGGARAQRNAAMDEASASDMGE